MKCFSVLFLVSAITSVAFGELFNGGMQANSRGASFAHHTSAAPTMDESPVGAGGGIWNQSDIERDEQAAVASYASTSRTLVGGDIKAHGWARNTVSNTQDLFKLESKARGEGRILVS